MRTFILSIASLLVFTGLAQAEIHEELFGVFKAEIYSQTDTNTVTLDSFSPYEFDAFYGESFGETVTSVNFSVGEESPISLFRHPDGVWELPEATPHHFSSIGALETAYPNSSSYFLEINTDLDVSPFFVSFTFGSTDDYFVAPQLSNSGLGFADGVLKFNFTQEFTFNWNNITDFEDGTDRLFLFIEEFTVDGGFNEVVDETFNVFQSSFTLSGNTLDPLKTYDMELIFGNVVGSIDLSIPGHTGIAAFGTVTFLELMHVPEPGTYSLIFGLAALGFVVLRRRRS